MTPKIEWLKDLERAIDWLNDAANACPDAAIARQLVSVGNMLDDLIDSIEVVEDD